jgi:serine/threonine protein kinase
MEYIVKGDLHNYLIKQNTPDEQESRVIATQLLEGLQVMHKHGFAHRDLKPQV